MIVVKKQNSILFTALVVALSVIAVSATSLTHSPVVYAQSIYNPSSKKISMRPEYPGPNEKVTVSINTTHSNIDLVLVTWRLNGEVVHQGYGETKYKFVTEEVGSYVNISVSLQNTDGTVVSISRSFVVADVAIAWEGKTYTPPFYRGRAPQSSGSEVVFRAVPLVTDRNGVLIHPSELVFEWTPSARYRAKITGKGKDSIVLRNSEPFLPFKMVLTVKDNTGEIRAVEKVSIPLVEPNLLFYQDHPLMGILYTKALVGSYELSSSEGSLVAEPYFMAVNRRTDPSLNYAWQVDNQSLSTPGRIILRPEGTGTARIQLVVSNSLIWQQKARGEIGVAYSSNNTSFGGQDTNAL